MTKSMKAYNQGKTARAKNISYRRNPYRPDTSTRVAWNMGFCAESEKFVLCPAKPNQMPVSGN